MPANRDVLYAIACAARGPLHARDFIRHAERDHNRHITMPSATVALANDPRFCWSARGVYGLPRHGLIPGPRNLEQLTRVVLVAAANSMTIDMVDYCLKAFGYRYAMGSLRNAAYRSDYISWSYSGLWDHPRSERAQLQLREEIPIVPPRNRAAWVMLRDKISRRVRDALAEREARLRAVVTRSDGVGISWEDL